MWILDNFKPYGRLQRGEYFMRSLLLLVQLGFWAFNAFAAGIGAVFSDPGRSGDSMKLTFLLVLSFGFLIAWQSFVLMLRRLQDIGWNPIFFFAGYAMFWLAEFFYFSTVPELAVTAQGVPMPISWLGATVPMVIGFALLFLPSAPESVGSGGSWGDSPDGGSSWADKIKLPTEGGAASIAPAAVRQGAPGRSQRGGPAKAQFGNRPARQR